MPVYRTAGAWGAGKGSNLTAAESDANIYELRSDIDDLAANPPTANSIATMVVTAQSFTTTLTNGTTLGPYAITLPVFRWRDTWATGTFYEELDSFSVSGEGIFVTLHDHISSAASFDAEAVGASENAGSFTIGATYKIASVGTTNFTLIGASANTVGTEFRATGVGTGTGTATRKLYRQLIGAGSNTRIEDLSDVTLLTGLVHADILVYDEDLTPASWANWTPAQYAAELPVFVGDDASPSVGGTKGLVPAPAIGDGAAGKYLDAQGQWSVPPVPASTLAALTDTDVTGAAADAFLVYDGADWTDRTPTQVTALLDAFVGDDASPAVGGTKGLVPAPASGDGAAGKVLTADGSWTAGNATSDLTVATLPLERASLLEVSEADQSSPALYTSKKITVEDFASDLTLTRATLSGTTTLPGSGRIDSSGNVGIGNTTPLAPLHFANATGDKIYLFTNAGGRSGFGLYSNELRFFVGGGAGTMTFGQADGSGVFTEKARFDTSFNLGIGTTIPQAKLHVGTTAATARVYNSLTDASNGEWGEFSWSSNVLNIGSNQNGTGTARDVSVRRGGLERILLGSSATTLRNTILVNGTSAYIITGSGTTTLQVQATSGGGIGQFTFINNAGGSGQYQLGKSRGTTLGDYTAVVDNDTLGLINIAGSDGSAFISAASIVGEVDGAVSAGIVPGRLKINVRTAAGVATERLAISAAGLVQFGGETSSFPALKRSSTVLQARLADDSDFSPLQGKLRSHANATAETPTATHTLRVFDAAGTEYKILAVAA